MNFLPEVKIYGNGPARHEGRASTGFLTSSEQNVRLFPARITIFVPNTRQLASRMPL